MPSLRDNNKFKEEVVLDHLPAYMLDSAIEWITSNMEPEDVFNETKLAEWAKNHGFVEEE